MASKQNKLTKMDFMKMSIELMKKCSQEPRADGKISPNVGAVLVFPNGDYVTSYRGELHQGDHAEFTAIKCKCDGKDLKGSTIYATLEPCAPGSRNYPKLGCSVHIVNAGIKEVYMGIEDPDPSVSGMGRNYLLDNGVLIGMYPPKLQEEISTYNKPFLDQAKDRALQKKNTQQIYLSEIEKPQPDIEIEDLREDLLVQYKQRTKILGDINTPSVQRQLSQLGIYGKIGEDVHPTGLALLLFGKNPQLKYPNALVRATISSNGKEQVFTFDGPLVEIPRKIEEWFKQNVESWIDRSSAERKQIYVYPMAAIREIVTNAIIHRDYDILGAPIYIEINESAIVVKSPGYPVTPITLNQIQRFSAPSLSRNPKLIFAFDKFDLAEQRGLGFKTVKSLPSKNNIPLPTVEFEDPYLVITMPLSYNKNAREDFDEALRPGIDFAKLHDEFGKTEYKEALDLTVRTAERQLSILTQKGILVKLGAGRGTKYRYNG